MKIDLTFPRKAWITFFWCSLVTALICLASIMAFVILMPDNEHGRKGIFIAIKSFGPWLILSALLAVQSFRKM